MAAPGFVMVPGWVFDAELSTAGKLVYAALLRYRDGEGTCYPSHRRLAVMTSTSTRTVQRALTELRDAGHVAWEARETEAGGPTSNLYTLADPYATVADPPVMMADPLGQPDVGAAPEGPTPYATVADEVDLLELDLPNETRRTSARERAPATRGTRVPDPFEITPEMAEWARQHVPSLDYQAVTEKFVDYWRAVPGAKGVKLDWTATWRNWLRTDAERRPARSAQGSFADDLAAKWAANDDLTIERTA